MCILILILILIYEYTNINMLPHLYFIIHHSSAAYEINTSVHVLTSEQCCCPQGKSLSSRILEDRFTSPCPSQTTYFSLSFSLDYILEDSTYCKQSVMSLVK